MRPLIMKLATKISVEAKSYTGITVNDPEYRILEPVVTDEMAEVALAAKVRKNMTAQEIAKRCKKPLEETKKLLWDLAVAGVMRVHLSLIHILSVNFSGASLREPSFVEQLTEICRSNGVLEKYMEIEVTERVHDVDGLDMKAVIKELRSAGFTVAIDDFGTEYANLSLLSEVDFDILKLDKSMIDHIATNPKSRAVVETVSKVCHKLGICMVAEGIRCV